MAGVLVTAGVSCLLTLGAATGGFLGAPPAVAAQPRIEVIQAAGFEVVDRDGNPVAYFGGAQPAPAILYLGVPNRVLMYTRYDGPTGIEIRDEASNPVWQVP